MRHATLETFQEIELLLEELRSVPGLVEKRPGIFYRRSKAFLHFHEDPSGLHPDVRFTQDGSTQAVLKDCLRRLAHG